MQFNQPDSLIPDFNNPLDWNRFLYARANPVRYSDSSGHSVDDGCRTEGCSTSEGEEYRDYVYNVVYNNNERRENQEKVETVVNIIEFGASIISEPIDWTLTARDCITGKCSPLVLLGLLPLVPTNKADDILDFAKEFNPNQDALIQLAKEAKKIGGVTEDEVKI